MVKSTSAKRSRKPADGFPLWKHLGTNRWCKKILGKAYYFGPIDSDPDGAAALEEWLRCKDDLLAGRKPRPKGAGGLTVGKLCNQFHATVGARIASGALAPRAKSEYRAVTDRLFSFFGAGRSVEDLRPDDFETLLASLPKSWNSTTKNVFISKVRAVFNYCHNRDQQLIAKPVGFGVAFRKSGLKEKRRQRATHGPRLFTADEICRAIAAAGIPFRAMLLLSANAAYGNTDIGRLPWTAIDGEWITFPRPKTGEPRRAWLWPETRAALEQVRQQGRKAADPADAGLVFVTLRGNPYVRFNGQSWVDSVSSTARTLLRKIGIEGRAFYDLRRTWRTVADNVCDAVVCNLVMGHCDNSMGATYRQSIDDARVKRVCEHVRNWLYGSKETK